MPAYYNEFDPYAAQWLRNLIAAGHIAPGDVDERSITEVHPDDLRGYTQCHFFAGIGGWSYALRLAGWPDDRPVWTGSCPCQPFSAAGKQRAADDERHLWPAFFALIRERRPGSVIGEQVAGSAGYAWWDGVATDLEGEGYAAAAADIGAHSVGAPHIRQRLYWVAHTEHAQRRTVDVNRKDGRNRPNGGRQETHGEPRACGEVRGMAHANSAGPLFGQRDGEPHEPEQQAPHRHDADGCGEVCWMGDADNARLEGRRYESGERAGECAFGQASPWCDLEWLACSDGKARPTQPGLFPLAHGVSGRVGLLRGYGNAIVPQVAAVFVMANLI